MQKHFILRVLAVNAYSFIEDRIVFYVKGNIISMTYICKSFNGAILFENRNRFPRRIMRGADRQLLKEPLNTGAIRQAALCVVEYNSCSAAPVTLALQ